VDFLCSDTLLQSSRLDPTAFRRKRVLTFPVMLVAMLSGFKASVQNELNAFFAHLANQADLVRLASAQAFSKARQNFSFTAFDQLNAHLLTLVDVHLNVPRWHGLRVVAADASKMPLFLQDATRRKVREVIAFALYLPGLEMTLAAELYSATGAERQMLFEHLDRIDERDLLVLDRGYPARWLAAYLVQQARHFCMRVDALGFAGVREFLRSGKAEQHITLRAPDAGDCKTYECEARPTTVRLIRVVTPNGRVHALMTSLLDAEAYPAADFGALYHQRWRIEEAFKRLKHRLAWENTSGLSWLAAKQDFGAKVLADNLHALTVLAAAGLESVPEAYKINRTYAFAHLKRCLPRWLLSGLPETHEYLNVITELARNLVRFNPDVSKPRPQHPKPHRRHAYKSTT
jgi:hypothetical protein